MRNSLPRLSALLDARAPSLMFVCFVSSAFSQVLYAKDSEEVRRYCEYRRSAAAAQADALLQPELFSSFTKEVDTRNPALEEDRYVSKWRYGLSLSVDELVQSFKVRSLADSECEHFKSSKDLQGWVDDIEVRSEEIGLQAKVKLLSDAVINLENQYALTKKRLESRTDSLKTLGEVSARLNRNKLLLIDTKAQLARIKHTHGEGAETKANLTEADVLATKQAADELRVESKRRSLLSNSLWKLNVSAGYEKRFYDQEETGYEEDRLKNRQPFYASVELTYQIFAPLQLYHQYQYEDAHRAWMDVDSKGLQKRFLDQKENLSITLKALNEKIAVLQQTQRDLHVNLQPLNLAPTSAASDFMRNMDMHKIETEAELAYLKAKVDFLSQKAGVRAESKAAESQEAVSVAMVDLKATSGELLIASDGLATTESSTFRAQATGKTSRADRIDVEFKVSGLSDEQTTLASGLERRQFGVYLLATNQCNLLYIMWRFDSDYLAVQRKSNPDKASHEECGNSGYETINTLARAKLPKITEDQPVRLRAEVKDGLLKVEIDKRRVWEGRINMNGLDLEGYSGVRSDNVKLAFKVFENREP